MLRVVEYIFLFSVERTKIQWKSIRDAYVKYQKKRLIYPKIRPYVYEKDMEFLLPQVVETFNKCKVVENYFKSSDSSRLQAEDSISISSCSDSDYKEIEEELSEKKEEPFEEVTIEYISKRNCAYKSELNLSKSEAGEMESEMFYNVDQCEKEQSAHLIENVNPAEVVKVERDRIYNIEQYKREHPVDAFFYGIAQTVKQLKPSTITKLKKTITNIVLDAETRQFTTN